MRNTDMILFAMSQKRVLRFTEDDKTVVEFRARTRLSDKEYAAEIKRIWGVVKTAGFTAAIEEATAGNFCALVHRLEEQRARVEFNIDWARAEQGVGIDEAIALARKAGHFELADELRREKTGVKNASPLTDEENERQAIAIARHRREFAKAA